MSKNQEMAIDIKTKVDFYLLSITFTVLGLSIQTAEFGGSHLADGFELIAWLCLFVSGVFGLSRMRWAASVFTVAHAIDERKQGLEGNKQAKAAGWKTVETPQGGQKPIDSDIKARETGVAVAENQLEGLQEKLIIKSKVHTWGFALGVAFLMCSRGLAPASPIAKWLAPSDANQPVEQPAEIEAASAPAIISGS